MGRWLILLLVLVTSKEDLAPMPADDYLLASFYNTWRRSQLKMMHFFGPGVAKVTLTAEDEGATPVQIEADGRILMDFVLIKI